MKTFEFTIIASGLDPQADDFLPRFYDGGCDDATVSLQKGRIIVDFAREAESFQAAVASALADVASTGATIERAQPEPLLSLNDFGSLAGPN